MKLTGNVNVIVAVTLLASCNTGVKSDPACAIAWKYDGDLSGPLYQEYHEAVQELRARHYLNQLHFPVFAECELVIPLFDCAIPDATGKSYMDDFLTG